MDASQESDVLNSNDMESVRALLFAQEKARIQALEERAEALLQRLQQQDTTHTEALEAETAVLQAEILALRQTAADHAQQAQDLQDRLTNLRTEFETEAETLVPRLTEKMSGMIRATIHNSRDEMAEALGPVMGEAIRVQIRDSRDEMVEALYPIILTTVQRAIAEFSRELQRNIDARLRTTFGFRSLFRSTQARLSGVSPADLAIRDALPFKIRQIFLIQHNSGLLLAQKNMEGDETPADSDLLSGMLTAIRHFARDSFGDTGSEGDLDEVHYGDAHITLQNGQYVYLAVVSSGVEPEWFRAQLRAFVAELHIQWAPALRDYAGDPATLPLLAPRIDRLAADVARRNEPETEPMSRGQKWSLTVGGAAGILLLLTACFYLQFTVALLPVAFGETPTPTMTMTATAVPTNTPTATPTATTTPTPTPTPTATPTPPFTATSTATPIPTNTATPMAEPSPTGTPAQPFTISPVWARSEPSLSADLLIPIPGETPLNVLDRQGFWVEVTWFDEAGLQRGWIPIQWVNFNGNIIPDINE